MWISSFAVRYPVRKDLSIFLKFCEEGVVVSFQEDLYLEFDFFFFIVSVLNCGVIFCSTCSPEEYYLLDILDYIYRLMRKDLRYYTMPRPIYK